MRASFSTPTPGTEGEPQRPVEPGSCRRLATPRARPPIGGRSVLDSFGRFRPEAYSGEQRGNRRLVARASRGDAFWKLIQESLWGIMQVNFREDPMLWDARIGRVSDK